MKKKQSKKSVAEMILELSDFLKISKTAKEIQQEIKDSMGHNVGDDQVKMALLRLLRTHKIERKKEGKIYKYHI